MAETTKGSLAPSKKLQNEIKVLGGSAVLIRANAEAVLNQPLFDADIIKDVAPNLNQHLSTAKGYAKRWTNKYQRDILNTLEHFDAYNNQFQNYSQHLERDAAKPMQGKNLRDFQEGLSRLQKSLQQAYTDTQATYTEITTYRGDLENDISAFSADVELAKAKLGTLQATKGQYLFNTDPAYAVMLDKAQLPTGLKKAFAANGHALNGTVIINIYTQGQEWALNEVSYAESGTYKGFDGYTTQDVYVLEVAQNKLDVYAGKQGMIANLHARYESDESAMQRDLAMIAGGAVMAVVGILVICVGALAEFETAGASTIVIGAGIALVGGGVGMAGYAGYDYSEKSDDASKTLVKIAEEEHLLAVMPGVLQQVKKLQKGILTAETALGNLMAEWQELQNKLTAVEKYVAGLDANDGWLTDDLNTAKTDWADVAYKVNAISYNFAHIGPIVTLPKGKTPGFNNEAAVNSVSQDQIAAYHAHAPVAPAGA